MNNFNDKIVSCDEVIENLVLEYVQEMAQAAGAPTSSGSTPAAKGWKVRLATPEQFIGHHGPEYIKKMETLAKKQLPQLSLLVSHLYTMFTEDFIGMISVDLPLPNGEIVTEYMSYISAYSKSYPPGLVLGKNPALEKERTFKFDLRGKQLRYLQKCSHINVLRVITPQPHHFTGGYDVTYQKYALWDQNEDISSSPPDTSEVNLKTMKELGFVKYIDDRSQFIYEKTDRGLDALRGSAHVSFYDPIKTRYVAHGPAIMVYSSQFRRGGPQTIPSVVDRLYRESVERITAFMYDVSSDNCGPKIDVAKMCNIMATGPSVKTRGPFWSPPGIPWNIFNFWSSSSIREWLPNYLIMHAVEEGDLADLLEVL